MSRVDLDQFILNAHTTRYNKSIYFTGLHNVLSKYTSENDFK